MGLATGCEERRSISGRRSTTDGAYITTTETSSPEEEETSQSVWLLITGTQPTPQLTWLQAQPVSDLMSKAMMYPQVRSVRAWCASIRSIRESVLSACV